MDDKDLRQEFYRWAELQWPGEYLSLYDVDRLIDAFIKGYRLKEKETIEKLWKK